ncbi:DUF3048 domain-containing protein [Intestinimonas butyriciproducens]|uniref:DUF3048 domain-containing protein n=1 Tax=Intestinimonas butyriciproducens TaxID=1297617 RepID=UPI0024322CF2|nr:DUF3048 domain-containing protein [Intestinimonas butyriciproducens]
MKRYRLLSAGLAVLLLLDSCSVPNPAPSEGETPRPGPTSTPEPEPTPYNGPENPLTGEPISGELANRRPIAVMLNNLKEALPQLGQSQADIIYECLAEGGITRMMGVYQSVEGVGMIGSVRSARPYYLELALGHDALYIHAGGSEDAYAKIRFWDVDHFDAVRGPYQGRSPDSNLMWRDADRRKNNGLEHSVVTTGSAIETYLPEEVRREHKEDYRYPQQFTDDGTPAAGEKAVTVTVPFSNYKTGVFTYDEESRTYLVEEYGQPYIDGNTGEQVGVTNVIILQTACSATGDSLAHITVDLTSGGEGWYACGGKIIPIHWSKADRSSSFVYTTEDGEPLVLGRGKSYVNIIPLKSEVIFA